MAYDIDALLRLWTTPLPEDDEAAADLVRELYTDPVAVNGTPTSALDLVARARVVQGTFEEPGHEVLEVVESGDQVAVAFRMVGRQVGPFSTTLGPLPPTGERLVVHYHGLGLCGRCRRRSTQW